MPTSTKSEQIPSPVRNSSAILLKQVRQLHLYLGVFFAPAIIFFSLTGAVQLFGLHEGHPGEAYQPPKWVEALASIHKDQVLSQHHGPPPGLADQSGSAPPPAGTQRRPEGPREQRGGEEHREGKSTLVLKWFFLAMAMGLVTTTLLGIYMAFKYNRSRVTVLGLLISGVVIPAALVASLA